MKDGWLGRWMVWWADVHLFSWIKCLYLTFICKRIKYLDQLLLSEWPLEASVSLKFILLKEQEEFVLQPLLRHQGLPTDVTWGVHLGLDLLILQKITEWAGNLFNLYFFQQNQTWDIGSSTDIENSVVRANLRFRHSFLSPFLYGCEPPSFIK